MPKISNKVFLLFLKMHGTAVAAGCLFAGLVQIKTYPKFSVIAGFSAFTVWLVVGALIVIAHLAQLFLAQGFRPWKVFVVAASMLIAPMGLQFISWILVAVVYATGIPLMLLALKTDGPPE
nr:hypothetical protein [uncultured Albidiferax sp.]